MPYPIRWNRNDREGALANTRYLIRLCPNGHEGALASLLEHVHRLVWFYRYPNNLYILRFTLRQPPARLFLMTALKRFKSASWLMVSP